MLKRLQTIERRYEEILGLLASEGVLSDMAQYTKLSKERAETEEVVL